MVYEKLDSCEIKEHPDIDGILDGLKNQDLEQVAASLGNVLEKVTVEAYPVIAQIKECMMEAGALGAMMSGSGPTVFEFSGSQDSEGSIYKSKSTESGKTDLSCKCA